MHTDRKRKPRAVSGVKGGEPSVQELQQAKAALEQRLGNRVHLMTGIQREVNEITQNLDAVVGALLKAAATAPPEPRKS